MKKALIGGILFLSGTLGISLLLAVAMLNPADAWVTPPGRLICTFLANDAWLPALGFAALMLWGGFVMLRAYWESPAHEKGEENSPWQSR